MSAHAPSPGPSSEHGPADSRTILRASSDHAREVGGTRQARRKECARGCGQPVAAGAEVRGAGARAVAEVVGAHVGRGALDLQHHWPHIHANLLQALVRVVAEREPQGHPTAADREAVRLPSWWQEELLVHHGVPEDVQGVADRRRAPPAAFFAGPDNSFPMALRVVTNPREAAGKCQERLGAKDLG
eukprot:CAMPEP_0183410976 /NCGR_PEP_ID=MMETSP0370-20130417/19968_1 /TAXON_ID=268820 /ORGANISM="Peridinium aciculiferum, Strain PAER-2" /LENGTH=186 /DNA_ID=CAMNT_0025593887 /DNA_START=252 /DNA_END=809 /DNA_ORIENTATION=+